MASITRRGAVSRAGHTTKLLLASRAPSPLYHAPFPAEGQGCSYPGLDPPLCFSGHALVVPLYRLLVCAIGWLYVVEQDHSYEDDAWNLNCLPSSDGSLLQFLGTQIQGVMVPWLYVGMAFR